MGRGPESPEVPECRTGGYRWAALRALASGKSGSLVLVSSPGRAVEVSFFLNRSGLTSAFVHPGVLPEEARDALEGFSSGRLGSLACTYGCAGDLGLNPVRVILFEVPYSPGDLDHDFPGCVEMHRLFGSGEALAGLEYLESLAPGRDRLADLYGMIRAGKTVFLEPDRAAGNLRRQGLARAGMHTLAYGLAVFTDLNLIECSPEDNGYRVIHKPARIKKDLRESVTFRTGQEIVEFTGKWLRNFISC